jgi:hypothetical protein
MGGDEEPAEPLVGVSTRLFVGRLFLRGGENICRSTSSLAPSANATASATRAASIRSVVAGTRATRAPTRGRTTSASAAPIAAITRRATDSTSTYVWRDTLYAGRKCRSSHR